MENLIDIKNVDAYNFLQLTNYRIDVDAEAHTVRGIPGMRKLVVYYLP